MGVATGEGGGDGGGDAGAVGDRGQRYREMRPALFYPTETGGIDSWCNGSGPVLFVELRLKMRDYGVPDSVDRCWNVTSVGFGVDVVVSRGYCLSFLVSGIFPFRQVSWRLGCEAQCRHQNVRQDTCDPLAPDPNLGTQVPPASTGRIVREGRAP